MYPYPHKIKFIPIAKCITQLERSEDIDIANFTISNFVLTHLMQLLNAPNNNSFLYVSEIHDFSERLL